MGATDIKLTEWTSCGGCAAKWGGAPLSDLVRSLAGDGRGAVPAELVVGLAPFDDAAVYRLSDDVALVSTTDFFPPLVDDPADYGAIAAANACSDVFAMGGRVLLALNVAAFPDGFPPEVIAEIFGAAADTVAAAGGVVAGGHTIRSEEPIFGLAVQGTRPPRPGAHKGRRPARRRARAVQAHRHRHRARRRDRRGAGGGRRRHAPAQPGGGSVAGRARCRRARRHRCHRVRTAGSRLGGGRALGHPPRHRRLGRAALRGGDGRGRGGDSNGWRPAQPDLPRRPCPQSPRARRWRRWPTTRRPRAGCWPPSIPAAAALAGLAAAGFVPVGEVAPAEPGPGVDLR